MAITMSNKRRQSRQTDPVLRLTGAMLRKLEANPHARYEQVLTAGEYAEARLMIRAAVAFVQGRMTAQRHKGKRPRPPSRFSWRGQSYPLRYGVFMGQIFIANECGKCLIGSGYDAI